MATPVCAGVVAQLLQLDGSLTPDQVKARLMENARTLNLDPNIQGAGVVDARGAAALPANYIRPVQYQVSVPDSGA